MVAPCASAAVGRNVSRRLSHSSFEISLTTFEPLTDHERRRLPGELLPARRQVERARRDVRELIGPTKYRRPCRVSGAHLPERTAAIDRWPPVCTDSRPGWANQPAIPLLIGERESDGSYLKRISADA